MERTLVLVKPDGVKRNLIGKIISRFEKGGLKVIAMKMTKVDKEFTEKHYLDTDSQVVGMGNKTLDASKKTGKSDEVKKLFGSDDSKKIGMILREWLIEFLTSDSVVAMILEGENAIKKTREITGFTDPSRADKGTIRGDLGDDSIIQANNEKRATKNLVHASGSKEEAENEIELWFPKI